MDTCVAMEPSCESHESDNLNGGAQRNAAGFSIRVTRTESSFAMAKNSRVLLWAKILPNRCSRHIAIPVSPAHARSGWNEDVAEFRQTIFMRRGFGDTGKGSRLQLWRMQQADQTRSLDLVCLQEATHA